MGNAAIYYYAEPGEAAIKIDLGHRLTTLNSWETRDQELVQAMSGGISRVIFSATRAVSFRIELIDDFDVAAQLYGFLNHVKAGGTFSLTENDATIFAGISTAPPWPGRNVYDVESNLFASFMSVGYLAGAGTYLAFEGPSPEFITELLNVGSATNALQGSLSQVHTRDFRGMPWVLVRDSRFWPFLKMTEQTLNNPALSPENSRVTMVLDFNAFVPPDIIDQIGSTNEPFPGDSDTETSAGSGGLVNLIDRIRDSNTSPDDPVVGRSPDDFIVRRRS